MLDKTKHRIYIGQELSLGNDITLDESQSHYLCNVLRLPVNACISAFDSMTGEYLCEIIHSHKKSCVIKVLEKVKDFYKSPDLWLLFAPIKKDNTDFVIQKSTELGVSKIIPVITSRTISSHVKDERLKAQAIEASEQSRRQDVPDVAPAISLENLLVNWDKNRVLYFLDEKLSGRDIATVFNENVLSKSVALLVGPEGGFSPEEAELLNSLPFTKTVSMGRRILRAETAAVASLAVWQSICGDWSDL